MRQSPQLFLAILVVIIQTFFVRAVFLMIKQCLPYMQKAAIVNVSSVHAHQPTPSIIPYAASKAAMEAITRGCVANMIEIK